MVRGRRARGARTHLGVVDSFCASPKRKDSKLDFSGKLSHSPTNQKQRSVVDEFIKTDNRKTKLNLTMDPFRATSKHQAITEYFQVQDRYQSETKTEDSNLVDSNFRMNDIIGVLSAPKTIDLTVEENSDAETESTLDRNPQNEVALSDDASLDSGVVVECSSIPTVSEDSNASSNECEIEPIISVRTSPRKNPSTLANAHLHRVYRTPHRIGQFPVITTDLSPSRVSNITPNNSNDTTPKKVKPADKSSSETKDMQQNENTVTGIHNSPTSALSQLRIAFPRKNVKSRRRLKSSHTDNTPKVISPSTDTKLGQLNNPPENVANKKNALTNLESNVQTTEKKLTDYFPIRRSIRKTKKTVLEERQRNIEEAIKAEVEEGLEVHNFPGKGRGIVASKFFARGSFVVEYSGDLISMTEARDRELIYARDENTGCYMYYFKHRNKQYCIDATKESGKLGRLVNHSRNGNLLTKTVQIGATPHLVLVAKDDIQPGEEVTYDYGDRSKESLQHHPWLAF
ncbi:N-lysine methyltransferase KMT5A-A [Ctenocephalides felis]|uniref:N-lysine methyltransferase KMT5A-A n=1 Tax=Ctenocephalides felis TaxID=7515 RepID=UPI000E6E273A|nr:N-lysine methyltransferase KMT5A-A [Ctenocephalides felis]